MTKFILIPFEKNHALQLIDQGTRETFTGFEEAVDKFSAEHSGNGIGFTLVADDKIVGCGGVDIAKDEGVAWVLLSPMATKYKKTVLRVVRTTLDGIIKQEHLKTVYALVACKDVVAQAFISVLNFVYQPSVPKVTGPDSREYLTYRRAA
jgi:hypothetical protein